MTGLNRSTYRRLHKLPQLPSVWEGDRRSLVHSSIMGTETDPDMQGECILWVDGSEAVVRAMDVVPPDLGPEAVVRTLIRAMEYPQSSVHPSRPQKIVVRDRELQFYLRGVLQDLDIVVDYVHDLPLIDEIFRGLQDVASKHAPHLPPAQAESLLKLAYDIWHDAPWEYLDEEKILAIEVNYSDIQTLYFSVLGMLGMEYGVLMYRSLDSLKQFRQEVLNSDDSPEHLQNAFLQQDCFFVTFDQVMDSPDPDHMVAAELEATGVQPMFGNLHPLEGMRSILDEEEAITVLIALTAFHRFLRQHQKALQADSFPALSSRYRIANPEDPQQKISVKASTMPDVAAELAEFLEDEDADPAMPFPVPLLRNDLVPPKSFYSLGAMSWEILEFLRTSVKFHQAAEQEFPAVGDGLPVILIQTSRPKALALIDELKAAGGVQAICFNPGEDPFAAIRYDLGILKVNNGDLHLFGEFAENDPIHVQARKKWDQRCKKTKGYCGLVIAKGVSGASKGNPDLKDMLALFEVRSLSSDDLGLGMLELFPQFDALP